MKISSYGAGNPNQFQTVLVRIDLDDDGVDEYLYLQAYESYFQSGQLYYAANGQWKNIAVSGIPTAGDVRNAIVNADIEIVRQRFGNVRLGDLLLRPLEEE